MQSEKQKKQASALITGGKIALVAFFLIAVIGVMESAKAGIGLAVVVAAAMLLVFGILVQQSRKNAKMLLDKEKADKEQLQAAIAQIEREKTAMENIQAALGSGP